jgi:hypothetical protein
MKYIKTYESINEPQIGDYVIIKIKTSTAGIAKNHLDDII